jgi:hypothetical protein
MNLELPFVATALWAVFCPFVKAAVPAAIA